MLLSNSLNENQIPGKLIVVDENIVYLNGTLVIGQDQDGVLAGYDALQSFSGEITNFNIWDGIISQNQVEFDNLYYSFMVL